MGFVFTGLLLVMAGLIAVIAFELKGDADRGRPAGPGAPAEVPEPPALPDPAVGSLSEMQQTAARPLFRRDRRPPPIPPVIEAPKIPEPAKAPETPIAAPTPAPPPVFRHALSAIVIADGEAFAYLRKGGEAGLARLRRGETLDGWRVEEVRPDSVVLTHGPTRTEVELRPPEPSTGRGPPTAARHDPRPRGRAPPPGVSPKSGPRDGGASGRNVRPDSVDPGSAPRSPRRPARGPRRESLERALRRATQTPGTNR